MAFTPMSSLVGDARQPSSRIHDPPDMELLIEHICSDPFQDTDLQQTEDGTPFQRIPSEGDRGFHKHSLRIKQILESHFRHFIFSVVVTDLGARLLRWDRSGVVVTASFDHTTNDNPLLHFLWRFDHLSDDQRGRDTTVSYPSEDEATLARVAFAASKHYTIPNNVPLRKVTVRDDVSKEETSYAISTPQTSNDRLVGPCFGYLAVDLRDGSLVWMKDVWRQDSPSFWKEGDVYRRLHQSKVPHIPPLRSAGDVGSHVTRCQEFVHSSWNCVQMDLPTRRHYRLVLGAVGRPLNTFRSTRELCTSVRDAVEAHAKTYKGLNILHGDISVGNILIDDDGHGLLIDWNLAFDADNVREGPVIGTWPFMSGRLMEKANLQPVLSDDLESFLHVLVYQLASHRPTGVPCLAHDLERVFSAGLREEEPFEMHMSKLAFFCHALLAQKHLVGHLNEPCANLVGQLRELFWRGIYSGSTVTPRSRKAALKALQSPDRVLGLFNGALRKRAWPTNDGSINAVAERRALLSRGSPTKEAKSSSFSASLSSSSSSSSGKRSAEFAFGDDAHSGSTTSGKRRRTSPQTSNASGKA
ncbi:kinase-like domain-containing protein [Amylostereum chailletii]|nr:kinase-like domain-containing protein [Amylostereum chailletii]